MTSQFPKTLELYKSWLQTKMGFALDRNFLMLQYTSPVQSDLSLGIQLKF